MIKKIIKLLLLIIIVVTIAIIYLSYFGIETKSFNQIIKEKVSESNKNIDIELNKVKILLNLRDFNVGINTLNPNIIFENKKIKLREIRTDFSIKSFVNKEFAIRNLEIDTKKNEIKDFISLIRIYRNTPQLFVFNKMIKEGTLKSDVKINFDENGKVMDDYNIEGSIINAKMRLLDKKIINNINSNFKIKKNLYLLSNININFKKIKLSSKNIEITKKSKDKYYKIKGDFQNSKIFATKEIISIFFKENFKSLNLKDLKFSSDNDFEFNIDTKLKVSNLVFKSKIDLEKFIYKKNIPQLKKYIPDYKNMIEFTDHKIQLTFNNKKITARGKGNYLIDKKSDEIKYDINLSDGNINFSTKIQFNNESLKLEILDYKKSKNKKSNILIEGNYKKNKSIHIKNLSFQQSKNKFLIKDLYLNNNFKFNSVKNIDLDFLNQSKKYNNFSLTKNNENYELNGNSIDATILIDKALEGGTNRDASSVFNNLNSSLAIKIDKTHIDKFSHINNLVGNIDFTYNKIKKLSLESNFSNNQKIILTINKTDNNEQITTLYSSFPKPLVKRYKFIKGFEEGVLDFYSIKKNNVSKSVLKIDNFKVKEVPVLAKLLSLASLQGIADLLTGEGIRFTDFEMVFSNKDRLMTIDEIYAIGPAISIMMSGYIEKDNLISLRGSLVPARTINRTIASIPVVGDILIGKKVGEGVFGVSFKIKGPPKKLKTTVNPIKTLTPRFITRTLEKLKKN